jgi:hypothetical protein
VLLGGKTPKHACEQLDQWAAFVREGVRRYGPRLPYWEVWNEPNLEKFWGRPPDPGDYVRLLKASYAAVKEANPQAVVLSGGFAYGGQGPEFVRRCYDVGMKDSFDVMNIHLYCWGKKNVDPAKFLAQKMAEARQTMSDYSDAGKPIWVTETGWPQIDSEMFHPRGLAPMALAWAADKVLGPSEASRPVDLLFIEDMADNMELVKSLEQCLRQDERFRVRALGCGQAVQGLRFPQTQIVVIPIGNAFPPEIFPALERFRQDGGLVAHFGGIPFYQTLNRVDGQWESKGAGDKWRQRFGLRFLADWVDESVPKQIKSLRLAQGVSGAIPASLVATRFLDVDQKAKGVKMIPFVEAEAKGGRTLCPAALFTYEDRQGGFFSATFKVEQTGVTEAYQAECVPLAYRVLLQQGAQVVYWFDLRDPKPTLGAHRFGLLRNDFTPKPAYAAYKGMALGDSHSTPAGKASSPPASASLQHHAGTEKEPKERLIRIGTGRE